MGKRIYLITIYSITAVCMLLGLLGNVIRPICNLSIGVLDGLFGEMTTASDEFTPDPFTAINIDVNISDITIEQGDSYHVSYTCANTAEPKFEVKDGVLTIKQKKSGKGVGKLVKNHCKVTITIPADVELTAFTLESSVGDLHISDLTAAKAEITLNVGDLNLTNCKFAESEIDLDVGDFDMKNCELTIAEIIANIGDVNLIDCASDDLTANLDIGNLSVSLTRPESDYTMSLSTSLGEVTVGGKVCKTKYKSGDGECKLNLESNIGDVTVKFGT